MEILEKDLQKIMSTPLFCGTDKKRLLQIFAEEGGEVRSFSAGELLLSPDTTEKTAGLLLQGKAVIHTPDPSKKTLLRFLGAEEPFGIANLFTKEPFVSVIRAHGNCRVFFLPEAAIRRLLEEDHQFLYHYLEFLSGRIHYLNRKIGYLTAGSPERRLALYLYSLGKKEFRLTDSISALSDLLNVSRASLYRAFDHLQRDGVLQKDGRRFYLPDPNAMLKLYK